MYTRTIEWPVRGKGERSKMRWCMCCRNLECSIKSIGKCTASGINSCVYDYIKDKMTYDDGKVESHEDERKELVANIFRFQALQVALECVCWQQQLKLNRGKSWDKILSLLQVFSLLLVWLAWHWHSERNTSKRVTIWFQLHDNKKKIHTYWIIFWLLNNIWFT